MRDGGEYLTLQGRLEEAYRHFHAVQDKDLPDDARDLYADLKKRLNAVADDRGDGTLRATLRVMNEPDARKAAELVTDIFSAIVREYVHG